MKSIIFLTHLGKGYPVQRYLGSWGSELRGTMRVRHYFGLSAVGRSAGKRIAQRVRAGRTGTLRRELANPAAGVYVFCDIERLAVAEKSQADSLWQQLAAGAASPRILNHPSRILDRFALLRKLYDEGINNFDAYLVEEGLEPRRWPVFIRHRHRHAAVLTDLLENAEELKAGIDGLLENGHCPRQLLIVEFCDTSDSLGITRKYGAFKVGGQILGRQIHFSRNWFLRSPAIKSEETSREELAYVRSDDHYELIERVFRLSGVDYGRLDYTVQDGQFYFWEINTNPMILIPADRDDPLRFDAHDHFAGRFREALEDL